MLIAMAGCCFVSAIDAMPMWCMGAAVVVLLTFLVWVCLANGGNHD